MRSELGDRRVVLQAVELERTDVGPSFVRMSTRVNVPPDHSVVDCHDLDVGRRALAVPTAASEDLHSPRLHGLALSDVSQMVRRETGEHDIPAGGFVEHRHESQTIDDWVRANIGPDTQFDGFDNELDSIHSAQRS